MTVPLFYPCVVPRNDIIIAKLSALIVKAVKFKISVASDTGIWCLSNLVAVNERLYYLLPKLSFVMIYVIRNAYLVANCSRIVCIIYATARSQKVHPHYVVFIKAHGTSHALVTSFYNFKGCD